MTGLLMQESKQEQESGQEKHHWTMQRSCFTYETILETQAFDDNYKAWDGHISSSVLQDQQQKNALWSMPKKINGKQEQRNLENRGLPERGLTWNNCG